MTGSPNPLGDEDYGTSVSLPALTPGDDIYVHLEFYLSDSDTLSDVKTYPAAIPDELSIYAQGYNN
jgi:hypothetical protein